MNQTGTPPKNYLVESILVTIFCCPPFGIVGIVYASQVNSKFNSEDVQGAIETSNNAKKWMKWGLYTGIALVVLNLIFIFGFGGMAYFLGN